MKNILVLIITLLFSFSASAYDCKVEKKKIIHDLMEDVECKQDAECGWFTYGYPWQPEQCVRSIINVTKENHNISNMRLIAEYNNFCIYPDTEEKKKFDAFSEEMTRTTCENPVRVYCYKGYCRSQSYAIYNDQ